VSFIDKLRELRRLHVSGIDDQLAEDTKSAKAYLHEREAVYDEDISRTAHEIRDRFKTKTIKEAQRTFPKTTPRRGIDLFGVCALALLAALALGAAYAALQHGLFHSVGELVGWLLVTAACIIAYASMQTAPPPPRNFQVHGTARPASEWEAQAAARGDTKTPFHDQKFSE
jgi:hypothetical protein